MRRLGLNLAYTVCCLVLIPATLLTPIALIDVLFVAVRWQSVAIVSVTVTGWIVAALLQRELRRHKMAACVPGGFPVVQPRQDEPPR